jgi:minor capsid protein
MLLDDVLSYLDAQSTSFTKLAGSAGNLAKAIALDANPVPDTLTVLYETPGTANAYTFSTSATRATVEYERPTLQILSRSTIYSTARSRAQTAYTILDGLANVNLPTSTGPLYLDFAANQPPFFLQRDANDRYICAVNFGVRKRVG